MRTCLAFPSLLLILFVFAPDITRALPLPDKAPGKIVGSFSLKLVTNHMICSGHPEESCISQVAGPRVHRFALRERRDGVEGAAGTYDLPSDGNTFHFWVMRDPKGETSIRISQNKSGGQDRVQVGEIHYNHKELLPRGVTFPGQPVAAGEYDALTVYTVE